MQVFFPAQFTIKKSGMYNSIILPTTACHCKWCNKFSMRFIYKAYLNVKCTVFKDDWGASAHAHTLPLPQNLHVNALCPSEASSLWPESRDGQRARWADSAEVETELCHSWSVSASRLIPCLSGRLRASFRHEWRGGRGSKKINNNNRMQTMFFYHVCCFWRINSTQLNCC